MNTRIDTDWVTDYLDGEAARAVVVDTFDDVVSGANIVQLHPRFDDRRRSPWTFVAVAAALVAVIGVGVALTSRRAEPAPINAAALPPGEATADTASPDMSAAPATTVPPESTAAPATLPAAPAGGIWLGGQQAICSAIDESSWSCTLPKPFQGDVPEYDDTGYALEYSSDGGLVTGGCRATNPEASAWTCYTGERAVQEEIIGEAFLGETVGTEFIAG